MSDQTQKQLALAVKKLNRLKKQEAFDPIKLDSVPTTTQQEVIDDFGKIKIQYIVAATQSGKSQTCARLVTWALTDTHPSWKRPLDWGSEHLLCVVAGRTGKQIEESLVPKIISYLEQGSYKIVRIGNITQRIELNNGNRFIFQSLENPAAARERIQSYVAHISWVDEMPPTAFILDELQRRVQARGGMVLASFTPLVINEDIRKMVDAAAEPYSKKYKFLMLDNPVYKDINKQKEILASMMTMPEHVRQTRLYGEWTVNDSAVYYFKYDDMVAMPQGYSPYWRHVVSVDPATQSALGLTIWAENPNSNKWYCIEADYVKGLYIPTEIVKYVEQRIQSLNVVRRISDPEASWYIHTASSMQKSYMGVNKHGRKQELIKQLQEKLGSGEVVISPNCHLFISELQECRYSDAEEGRIVNSSKYHILDSAQYFCDSIPRKEDKGINASSWDDWLYKANEIRVVAEEKQKSQLTRGGRRGSMVFQLPNTRWVRR